MKNLKAAAILLCLAGFAATMAFAADESAAKKPAHKMASMEKPVILTPGDVQWGAAPPVFAAGAKMAVLEGNPGKAGQYTVRLQMPDGYKIMPHWHPTVEKVTVISGEFHAGMGDELEGRGQRHAPGRKLRIAAGAHAPFRVGQGRDGRSGPRNGAVHADVRQPGRRPERDAGEEEGRAEEGDEARSVGTNSPLPLWERPAEGRVRGRAPTPHPDPLPQGERVN